MLVYRTGRNLEKLTLKRLHALLHFVAFILSVIGLKAVFDSHNYANPPTANLYTLHSWIGLITVILFAAQARKQIKIVICICPKPKTSFAVCIWICQLLVSGCIHVFTSCNPSSPHQHGSSYVRLRVNSCPHGVDRKSHLVHVSRLLNT